MTGLGSAEREFKLGLQLVLKMQQAITGMPSFFIYRQTKEAFKEIDLAVELDPISQEY
jgi:hypothetical protein